MTQDEAEKTSPMVEEKNKEDKVPLSPQNLENDNIPVTQTEVSLPPFKTTKVKDISLVASIRRELGKAGRDRKLARVLTKQALKGDATLLKLILSYVEGQPIPREDKDDSGLPWTIQITVPACPKCGLLYGENQDTQNQETGEVSSLSPTVGSV